MYLDVYNYEKFTTFQVLLWIILIIVPIFWTHSLSPTSVPWSTTSSMTLHSSWHWTGHLTWKPMRWIGAWMFHVAMIGGRSRILTGLAIGDKTMNMKKKKYWTTKLRGIQHCWIRNIPSWLLSHHRLRVAIRHHHGLRRIHTH